MTPHARQRAMPTTPDGLLELAMQLLARARDLHAQGRHVLAAYEAREAAAAALLAEKMLARRARLDRLGTGVWA
jgi:hypothetical protein